MRFQKGQVRPGADAYGSQVDRPQSASNGRYQDVVQASQAVQRMLSVKRHRELTLWSSSCLLKLPIVVSARAEVVEIVGSFLLPPRRGRHHQAHAPARLRSRPRRRNWHGAEGARQQTFTVRMTRGTAYGYAGFAYVSALITSMPTKGSLPSTQASCPGGIV